jgi:hypothetical protein
VKLYCIVNAIDRREPLQLRHRGCMPSCAETKVLLLHIAAIGGQNHECLLPSHLREYSALSSSNSLASATSEAQQDSSNLHLVPCARSCPTYSR